MLYSVIIYNSSAMDRCNFALIRLSEVRTKICYNVSFILVSVLWHECIKMIYNISICKIRFIVYLLTIHEIISLFVSCNDFSMSLFGEKTRLRNMKEVNAQFYLLRTECCSEREISRIKTELHALT